LDVPACSTAAFLGSRFRELRLRHELTQEQAAKLTKTEYKYWQLLEAGAKDLRLTTLEKIAAAFGLEAKDLFASRLPRSSIRSAPAGAPHRPRRRPSRP
jgi:transcriptional regulator with XRE-family HTH domain